MTATRREVTSGVLWSLVRTWGSRLIGFVIYFQLARLLTPADMGLFAACFAVLSLMEILVDLGLIHAIARQPQLSRGQLNAVFVVNLALAAALLALLAAASPWLEAWLQAPGLQAVILLSGLGLLFNAFGMCQEALARKALDFRLMATRTLLSTTLSGAVGVGLAYLGFGVWALVWQFVLACAINTLTMWFRPRWRPTREMDLAGIGGLVRFGLQLLSQRLVSFADSRGSDLLIGMLLGPVALGIYSVGTKLQYIFTQLLCTALVDVAYPAFARLQQEVERLRAAHLNALRTVSLVAMPMWGLLATCAEEAVAIAFGPRWEAAAPVLQAFACLGVVQTFNLFDTPLFNAMGKPKLSLHLGLLRATAVLAAVACVGQRGSVAQIAWAVCAAQALMVPCFLWALHIAVGTSFKQWLRVIAAPLCGTLVMMVVIEGCKATGVTHGLSSLARLLLLGAAGGAAYAGFLLCTVPSQLRRFATDLRSHKASPARG
jgi:PST family polysaccharide transporter